MSARVTGPRLVCPLCGRAVGTYTYVGTSGEPHFNRHGHRNFLGVGGGGCESQCRTLAWATERQAELQAKKRAERAARF